MAESFEELTPERLRDAVFGRPETWPTPKLEEVVGTGDTTAMAHPLWERAYEELERRKIVQQHLPSTAFLMESEAAALNGILLHVSSAENLAGSALARGVGHVLDFFGASDAAAWTRGYADELDRYEQDTEKYRTSLSMVSQERRAAAVTSGETSHTVAWLRRQYEGLATSLGTMATDLTLARGAGLAAKTAAPGASFVAKRLVNFYNQLPLGVGFGVDQFSRSFQEGRNAGLDPSVNFRQSLRQGFVELAVQSLFSLVGMGGLEDKFSAPVRAGVRREVGQLLRDLGVSCLQEVPEELLTNVIETTMEAVDLNRGEGLTADALGQLVVDTITQTCGLCGLTEVGHFGLERAHPARSDALFEQHAEALDALAKRTDMTVQQKFEAALIIIGNRITTVRADATEGKIELDKQNVQAEIDAAKAQVNASEAPVAPSPVPSKPENGKPYTATVYRGTSEQTPVDEGMYGKGIYYTTDQAYAADYGTVTTHKLSLKKAFVPTSVYVLEELGNPARIKAKQEGKSIPIQEELASRLIRETLERQGYDGIVLVEGLTGGPDEVVTFVAQPESTITTPTPVPSKPKIGVEGAAVEAPPETPPETEEDLTDPDLYADIMTDPDVSAEDRAAAVAANTKAQRWVERVIHNAEAKGQTKSGKVDLITAAQQFMFGKYTKRSAPRPDLAGQYRLLEAIAGEKAGLKTKFGRTQTVQVRLESALTRWLEHGGRGGSVRTLGRVLNPDTGERAKDTSKPKAEADVSLSAETAEGEKNPEVVVVAVPTLTPLEELIAAEGEEFRQKFLAEVAKAPKAQQQAKARELILALPEDHPLRIAYEWMFRSPAPLGMNGGKAQEIDINALVNAIATGHPHDKVDLWVIAHGQGTRVTPTTLEHQQAVAFMQSIGIELRLYTTVARGGVYLSRKRLESWGEPRKRPIVLLAKGFTGSELAGAVVHESVHYLRTEHPDLYTKLAAQVPAEVRTRASEDYYSRLSPADRILYDAYYVEEGVATALQLPAQHKAFWDAFYAEAATEKIGGLARVVRKLADAILKWLHQVYESATRLGLEPETFNEMSTALGEAYGKIMKDVRDRARAKTMTEVFTAANDVGRALGDVAPGMGRRAVVPLTLEQNTHGTWVTTLDGYSVVGMLTGRDKLARDRILVQVNIDASRDSVAQLAEEKLDEPGRLLQRMQWVPLDQLVLETPVPGMGRRAVAPLTAEQAALFEREDVKGLMAELDAARKAKDSAAATELRAKLDALGATKALRESFYNTGGTGGAPARPTRWTTDRIARAFASAERLVTLRTLVTSFAELEHGEVAADAVAAITSPTGHINPKAREALIRELTSLRQWFVVQTAGVRPMGAALTREHTIAVANASRTYAGYKNAGSSTSMEHVVARWGTQHKLPWQYVATALNEAVGRVTLASSQLMNKLRAAVGSTRKRKIAAVFRDTVLEQKIRDALQDPKKVEALTSQERKLYEVANKHVVDQETDVRTTRVLHNWRLGLLPSDAKGKNTTDIHGPDETNLVPDLVHCREIIERSVSQQEVLDTLDAFLKDKTWGVRENYAPRDALLHDYHYYARSREGDPSKLTAPSLEMRKTNLEPEYQGLTLWQLLDRNTQDLTRIKYMEMPLETVDAMRGIMLRNIRTELTEGRMTKEQYTETTKTLNTQLNTWLRSLTGHDPQTNPWVKNLLQWQSAGLTVHFATQMLTIQNVAQMLVNTDITAITQLFSHFPNADAAMHFALFSDESRFLGSEMALRDTSVTKIPGFKQAFGFLKWLGRTGERTDYVGRKSAFIERRKKVERAFRKLKPGDATINAARARASSGLTELTDAQWAYAQELWAARGVNALANYAAEQHVAVTFYEYMPHKRSFAEQGPAGRMVASLYTFSRCYIQRLLIDIRKVGQTLSGRIPLTEGTRAAARVAFVIVMTNVTARMIEAIARGRTEEEKDLDAEKSALWQAVGPEGAWEAAAYSPGGYGATLVLKFKDFVTALGDALQGRPGADSKLSLTLTSLAKTFVPFYRHVVAAINISLNRSMRRGSWDKEMITRLQNVQGILNKTYEYEMSPLQARTALEQFQAFLYGKDTGLVHATATATEYTRGNTDEDRRDYGNRASRYIIAALKQGNPMLSLADKAKAFTEATRLENYFTRRGIALDPWVLSWLIFDGTAADQMDFEKELQAAGTPPQDAAAYYVDELHRRIQESKK